MSEEISNSSDNHDDNQEDGFGDDLVKTCLDEVAKVGGSIKGSIERIQGKPKETIGQIVLQLHNVDGHLRAAGFSFCADYVQQMMGSILEVDKVFEQICEPELSRPEILSQELLSALAAQLNEIFTEFDSYLSRLSDQDDTEELKNSMIALKGLDGWTKQVLAAMESQEPSSGANGVVTESQIADSQAEGGLLEELAPAHLRGSDDYLLFQVGGQWLAVLIQKVVEIIQWQKLDRLPYSHREISGILNFRGDALPIFDLIHVLDSRESGLADSRENQYIVISQINGIQFGFAIEGVDQVRSLDQDSFQEAKYSREISNIPLIKHLSILEERTVLILELDGICAA